MTDRIRQLERIGHAAWPSFEDQWFDGWLLRIKGRDVGLALESVEAEDAGAPTLPTRSMTPRPISTGR